MRHMKALVLSKGKLRLEHLPKPVPSEDEALIRILKAGICNTDLELSRGYMSFEGIMGHEFVGRVVTCAQKDWVGKRVVGEINIGCGECADCGQGRENHCPSRKVLGILGKNGALAEFTTLPVKNLHLVPEDLSDTEAVFVEPLAAALEILEQVRIEERDSVLVLGDGKLGLLVARVMKLRTPHVSCIGKHARKLGLLRNKNITTFQVGDDPGKHTLDGRTRSDSPSKYECVVEVTGKPSGLKAALLHAKPRGNIVIKSTYLGESCLDMSKVVVNEIMLVGSRCGPFDKALRALHQKRVSVLDMVDDDFPLNRAVEAFALARKPGSLKVLITP